MKYTVVLMDTELSEHVGMTFHVTADDELGAIRQAYLDYAADGQAEETEADRLGSLEFALAVLEPIMVYAGHVNSILPAHKTVHSMVTKMLRQTEKESDRRITAALKSAKKPAPVSVRKSK